MYSEFGEDEFRHCFLPREGVVDSFVVQNPDTGEITDLCSFYHLPSSIIGHKQHNKLNAAYSFYNVATSVSLLKLMQDCLTLARIVSLLVSHIWLRWTMESHGDIATVDVSC